MAVRRPLFLTIIGWSCQMSACGEGQIDHAGCFCTQTWERTKVINFWFSHTKTWDVYLLTCNRARNSRAAFDSFAAPTHAARSNILFLPAAKLQPITFYDVFTISACWIWSHLMNFLFVSMCKTNSRQLQIITAASLSALRHVSLDLFATLLRNGKH